MGRSYESAVSLTLCNACNPKGQLRIQKILSMQADENKKSKNRYIKYLINENIKIQKSFDQAIEMYTIVRTELTEIKKTLVVAPPIYEFYIN